MRLGPLVWPLLVIVTFVVLLGATVWISSRPGETTLENALWSFILFGAGIVVTYASGRKSAERNAQDVIRPHAKKAVRRLTALARSLYTISNTQDTEVARLESTAAKVNGAVTIDDVRANADVIRGLSTPRSRTWSTRLKTGEMYFQTSSTDLLQTLSSR